MIKSKRYKNIEYPKCEIYDFEYLKIESLIEETDIRLGWRIGKFIDYVYRLSLKYMSNGNYDEVYVSDKIVRGILGELSHNKCISFLDDNNLIRCRRKGNNRFNYNKKLWFFRLNREFFRCKKRKVKIELGVLNKWIGNKKKRKEEIYKDVKILKDEDGNIIDGYVRNELKCCLKTDIVINEIDSVIENRINNKLKYLQNESLWNWISNDKKEKNKKLLKNIDNWKLEYRNELINRYQYLREDLFNFKNGNYENVVFKRDEYGGRLYNLYSRVIREFRNHLVIDGEESVEVDIKSSHISCLYYLIVELNNKNCNNDLINDIKSQLEKLGNKNLGKGFLIKHKILFEGDGVFINDNIEIDEYNDFYGFMKSCFNDDVNREEMKIFTQYILNSDTLRSRKNFKYKGYNIDDLEKLFFGNDGFRLINDLKKIDLFKYVSKGKGRIKPFNRSKNISLILHKIENQLMDKCRDKLIENNITYISIFDSFIVKKNEGGKVLKMLNSVVNNISKVVKFRSDIEIFKNS